MIVETLTDGVGVSLVQTPSQLSVQSTCSVQGSPHTHLIHSYWQIWPHPHYHVLRNPICICSDDRNIIHVNWYLVWIFVLTAVELVHVYVHVHVDILHNVEYSNSIIMYNVHYTFTCSLYIGLTLVTWLISWLSPCPQVWSLFPWVNQPLLWSLWLHIWPNMHHSFSSIGLECLNGGHHRDQSNSVWNNTHT